MRRWRSIAVLLLCMGISPSLNGVARAAPAAGVVVPGPPETTSAVPGDQAATVSWTAPASDGGAAVSRYEVTTYSGYAPIQEDTFNSSATTQTVTGLTNGSTYRFRVRAISAAGASGYSRVTSSVTPLPEHYVVFDGQSLNLYGGYPKKLMANHLSIPYTNACTGGRSWTALAATAPDRLYGLANAGQTTILIMNGGTSDLFEEHDDGPTLYADERAYAEVARAAGFDHVIGTTTTPSEYFSTTMDERRLVANALLLANADAAFDGTVDFDVDLGPALSLHDSSNPLAYPDGVHWSPAAAQVAAGLVDEQLRAILGPPTPPGSLRIGAVAAGPGSATVSWTPPVSDGGALVTGYVVTPYVGSVAQDPTSFDSTSTTQTVSGLASGVRHTFTVAAVNSEGLGPESSASSWAAPLAPTVPSAPAIIRNATATDGSATVSWAAPTSDGGRSVTGYVVTPYIGYFPLAPTAFGSIETTQTMAGLPNGFTYRFRVQAVNAVGTGGFSRVTNPVTLDLSSDEPLR